MPKHRWMCYTWAGERNAMCVPVNPWKRDIHFSFRGAKIDK